MNSRTAGVLLHPTSLANPYPLGDIGPAAYRWVDCLRQCQQHCWQILPIGPTGNYHSPYDGYSAFAGNPLLISPEQLHQQGLLRHDDFWPVPAIDGEPINYPLAIKLKMDWLQAAFARFEASASLSQKDALNIFIIQEASWLDDYSLFLALKAKFANANWTKWDHSLRTRDSLALKTARKTCAQAIRYQQFVQWQFALQWQQLKQYCQQQQVELIGDIPLFIAHQSADVWANPELFKLTAEGQPTVVAGVPPDFFSATGQFWNVPVYNWQALAEQDYAWWIARIRKSLTQFDSLRLDHFIGFVRTYEIPAGAKNAKSGHYMPCDGAGLFRKLHAVLGGDLPFIAEDLGIVTAEVEQLRQRWHIPSMHVLQFDFEASLNATTPLTNHYPEHSVLYTGTHDNNTTLGWFRELKPLCREVLTAELDTTEENFNWAAIKFALASSANRVIIPLQDLLNLPTAARMNTPGSLVGNWRWRMSEHDLNEGWVDKLKQLTEASLRFRI